MSARPISGTLTTTVDPRVAVWDQWLILQATDSAQRIRVVGAFPMSALKFETLLNPASDAGHLDAFLFDVNGRALASTRADQVNVSVLAHPGVAEALSGLSGGMFSPDPGDSDEHIVSYAPIETARGLTGLGMVVEEPWEAVLDPLMRYSLAMPLITLPVLFTGGAGSYFWRAAHCATAPATRPAGT